MRDLKDLLEPLSQEDMPDRWSDIGGRSPGPLVPIRRGSRVAAIVVAFAVVAAAGVLTWRALRPVDRVGAGAVSNGAIAYLRQSLAEDSHAMVTEIRIFDPRTGEDRSLIALDTIAWGPDWSPNGRLLLYERRLEGVFAIDAATGEERRVARPGAWGASWSPDGTQIVYTADRDGSDVIEIANADGKDPRVLTEASSLGTSDWSPDGTRIVFDGPGPEGARQGWDIYVIDVDGTNLVNLTNSDTVDLEPQWSPDGSTILFRSRRDPPPGWTQGDAPDELYLMAPDGSDVRRLTEDSAIDQWGTWSPDGSLIVFNRQLGEEPGDLFTIRPDGTGLTPLGIDGLDPAWQPVATDAPPPDTEASVSPTPPTSTQRLEIYEALIRHLADPDGPQPIYVLSDLCVDLMESEPRCPDRLTREEQRELAARLQEMGELEFRTGDDDPDPLREQGYQEILLGPIVERPDGVRVEGGSVCGGLCGSGAVYVLVPTEDGYRVTGTDDAYGAWIA